jgi:hypothetical protein
MEVEAANEEEPAGAEEQENLPTNTTIMSIPDTDITHNPAYDRGTLPTLTVEEIQQLDRDMLVQNLDKYQKRKEKSKDKMNLDLIEQYAEKVNHLLIVNWLMSIF